MKLLRPFVCVIAIFFFNFPYLSYTLSNTDKELMHYAIDTNKWSRKLHEKKLVFAETQKQIAFDTYK